jgi:hypothetical protein
MAHNTSIVAPTAATQLLNTPFEGVNDIGKQ